MIWEQQSSVIIMSTNLIEGGKTKCARYWPAPGQHMKLAGADLNIQGIESALRSGYVLNTFMVTSTKKVFGQIVCSSCGYRADAKWQGSKAKPRKVLQYWINFWPDHGVPASTDMMIALLHDARKNRQATRGPIVVHCSAGLGMMILSIRSP